MKNTVSTSGGELAVVVGELELRLEVAIARRPRTIEPAPTRAAEVDGQPVERLDLDASAASAGVARAPSRITATRVVDVEQRRLARVGEDGDDDRVEHARGTRDDVQVAVRDRVEGAGIDRDPLSSPASARR